MHQFATQNHHETVCKSHTPFQSPPPQLPFRWIACIFGIANLYIVASDSFITYDENGIPQLAKWRQEKLAKELDDLDGAEQYVLRALDNSYYPCYSCPNTDSIYLTINQVWKYGITTKGEYGRYRGRLTKKRLRYIIQFEGTLTECLKEQKRKIYGYGVLPENLARTSPLIRPPGNKRDN